MSDTLLLIAVCVASTWILFGLTEVVEKLLASPIETLRQYDEMSDRSRFWFVVTITLVGPLRFIKKGYHA